MSRLDSTIGVFFVAAAMAIGCGEAGDPHGGGGTANAGTGGSGGEAGTGGGGGNTGGVGGSETPPLAPSQLQATFVSGSMVDLEWADRAEDESGFRVERTCAPSSNDYSEIATLPPDATQYQDGTALLGATCHYRVLAFNDAGNSTYSNVASVDVPGDRYALEVRKSVSGNGVVAQSDPSTGEMIVCGSTCSATYEAGTTVTLVAQPAGPDTFFATWDGCDGVNGTECVVTVDSMRQVTANFFTSMSITEPPSPDENGEYALRWVCSSPLCLSTANAYYVVQEDNDDQFEDPAQFIQAQIPQVPNAGARLFVDKADDEYCYRVSFSTFANWSAAHCVTVTRTPANLPKTGQRASYANRDDGWLEKGVTWPSPRFTVNPGGTITDELTGLMWLADANCMASEYPGFDTFNTPGDGAVTWTQAHAFVAGINSGVYARCSSGYDDWRLPNVNEMLSLAHDGQDNPVGWLQTQGFSGPDQVFWYWTSTSALDPTFVMNASIGGLTSWASRGSNYTIQIAVWPLRTADASRRQVWQTNQSSCYDGSGNATDCAGTGQDGETRSGAVWPFVRFVNNGDGTVRDALTGLVWLADADCMNTHYPQLSSVDGEVYWQEAIDFVGGANAGTYPACSTGYDDWRLPNIIELRSLLDFEEPLESYASFVGISNLSNVGYWSSTSLYHPTGYIFAKTVAPSTGIVYYGIKDSEFQRQHVWMVRAGD